MLSTARTNTSGSFETVNLDHRFAALEGNPFQRAQELAKAQVRHLATPQCLHARQIQVLEVQHVKIVTQRVGQVEVVVTAFVGDVALVLRQGTASLLVAVGAFDFTRQFTIQPPRFAKALLEKLRAVVANALIVHEKVLQPKIETAALTRAGFGDCDLLKDAEDKPQPAYAIPLDGQRFDLTAYLTVLDELVLGPANRDGVTLHRVARLREGERGVFLGFPEFRPTFRQALEETLVGIIHAAAHILAALRVQVLPQCKALRSAQLQNVGGHAIVGDVLASQPVVASLQGDEVVPDGRRDKYLVSQLAVFLVAAIQAVFVRFPNFDRIADHALALAGWRVGGRFSAATHILILLQPHAKCNARLISPGINAGALRRRR
jgi:hypothetical protein